MGREVSNRADGLRFKLAPGLDSRPAHTPQVLVGGEIRLKSVQHMENVQVQFGRGKKPHNLLLASLMCIPPEMFIFHK